MNIFKKIIIVSAVSMFAAGCAGGPKYNIADGFKMPADAKIGLLEQISCTSGCSEDTNPKLFTETMKSRLESKLNKTISVISMPADLMKDYTPARVASLGKAAGVDFVIVGRLDQYNDPSSSARAGSAAITTLTAILPVHVGSSQRPSVSSLVLVIRVADSMIVGEWNAMKFGGNFTSCTSLTEEIADGIVENQFAKN